MISNQLRTMIIYVDSKISSSISSITIKRLKAALRICPSNTIYLISTEMISEKDIKEINQYLNPVATSVVNIVIGNMNLVDIISPITLQLENDKYWRVFFYIDYTTTMIVAYAFYIISSYFTEDMTIFDDCGNTYPSFKSEFPTYFQNKILASFVNKKSQSIESIICNTKKIQIPLCEKDMKSVVDFKSKISYTYKIKRLIDDGFLIVLINHEKQKIYYATEKAHIMIAIAKLYYTKK